MVETELDETLEIARANPAQANFFYDTFLNSPIFVPAQKENKKEGSWELIKSDERFFPLYLRNGITRAVPVFDRLERLQAWADPKIFDYILLPAHIFLKVIAKDVEILLNEGTDYNYHMTAEILESIRQVVRPVTPS